MEIFVPNQWFCRMIRLILQFLWNLSHRRSQECNLTSLQGYCRSQKTTSLFVIFYSSLQTCVTLCVEKCFNVLCPYNERQRDLTLDPNDFDCLDKINEHLSLSTPLDMKVMTEFSFSGWTFRNFLLAFGVMCETSADFQTEELQCYWSQAIPQNILGWSWTQPEVRNAVLWQREGTALHYFTDGAQYSFCGHDVILRER